MAQRHEVVHHRHVKGQGGELEHHVFGRQANGGVEGDGLVDQTPVLEQRSLWPASAPGREDKCSLHLVVRVGVNSYMMARSTPQAAALFHLIRGNWPCAAPLGWDSLEHLVSRPTPRGRWQRGRRRRGGRVILV